MKGLLITDVSGVWISAAEQSDSYLQLSVRLANIYTLWRALNLDILWHLLICSLQVLVSSPPGQRPLRHRDCIWASLVISGYGYCSSWDSELRNYHLSSYYPLSLLVSHLYGCSSVYFCSFICVQTLYPSLSLHPNEITANPNKSQSQMKVDKGNSYTKPGWQCKSLAKSGRRVWKT